MKSIDIKALAQALVAGILVFGTSQCLHWVFDGEWDTVRTSSSVICAVFIFAFTLGERLGQARAQESR